MAIYQIPAETFRDLLLNVEGDISPASPFAFLLGDEADASLEPHVAWLEEQGYLDSPAEQEGRLALLPPLRRALDVVARPIRRILVGEVNPEGTRRAVYASDGDEVVVAMFDEEDCLVSDPVELEAFYAGLVEAIGPAAEAKSAPKPVQLNPIVLSFLGALVGPVGPEDELASSGDGKSAATSWPVARSRGEARLAEILGEEDAAEELLDGLIADEVLAAKNGKLDIHPSFRTWHQAITSGYFLEIQRVEIPDSQLEEAQLPVKAYFVGPPNSRVLIWPAGDESDEVILSQPTQEELKSFVSYLVGYIEPEE